MRKSSPTSNQVQQKPKISKIQRFLVFASGADIHILEKCPPSEVNKYASMGAVVTLTAVWAGVGGGYAFYFVFKNSLLAFVFGSFWAIIIFNLDRYIVMSMRKPPENFGRQELKFNWKSIREWFKKWGSSLGMAIPRFIIALIIALTISKPLELVLFERRIQEEMESIKNAKIEEFDKKYNSEIEKINKQLEDLNKQEEEEKQKIYNNDPIYNKRIQEKKELEKDIKRLQNKIASNNARLKKHRRLKTDYRTVTKTRPDGTTYQEEEKYSYWVYDNIGKRLLNSNRQLQSQIKSKQKEITDIEKEIKEIEKKFQETVDKKTKEYQERREALQEQIRTKKTSYSQELEKWKSKVSQSDDLLARLEALGNITEQNSAANYASWFITLLFIALETAPLVVKMLTKRGPYDEILDAIEHEYKVESGEYISKINSKINAVLRQLEEVAKLEAETFIQTEKQRIDNELKNNEKILKKIAEKQEKLADIILQNWFEQEKEKIQEEFRKLKKP